MGGRKSYKATRINFNPKEIENDGLKISNMKKTVL